MSSPRALIGMWIASCLALVGAVFLLFLERWVAGALVVGIGLLTFAVAVFRLRRVDKTELAALSARNQRWLEIWARSIGRAGGGWDPPRRGKED